uniref:Uncharacterized protein n=1 Tax=Strigamia maritima TaxID=126957 RepID=T1IRL4_STRMM
MRSKLLFINDRANNGFNSLIPSSKNANNNSLDMIGLLEEDVPTPTYCVACLVLKNDLLIEKPFTIFLKWME